MKKTPEEIKQLKENWESDPSWDLEKTEGFEDHEEELRAYRFDREAKWKYEYQQNLEKRAEQLGVPGNTKLVEYIIGLEQRIQRLEIGQSRFVCHNTLTNF